MQGVSNVAEIANNGHNRRICCVTREIENGLFRDIPRGFATMARYVGTGSQTTSCLMSIQWRTDEEFHQEHASSSMDLPRERLSVQRARDPASLVERRCKPDDKEDLESRFHNIPWNLFFFFHCHNASGGFS